MNFKRKEKNITQLNSIIEDSFRLLGSTPSRSEALRRTAERASRDFGDYITPGGLNLTNEIHIILVELLDQIIYEFRENQEYDLKIRDYIIDDLYSRLLLILEALNSKELYLKNIRNRSLFHDDLVIIKKMKLAELVPVLISESEDITHLQVQIIKTLLNFTDEVPLDFFYNCYKNTSSCFIRAASLLGLKYSSSKGLNWKTVRETGGETAGPVQYAEAFDLNSLRENRLPETKEELMLALLHVEIMSGQVHMHADIEWTLEILSSCSCYTFDSSYFTEIHSTLGNILLNLDVEILKYVLRDKKKLISTTCFIDRLPKNIFNRITGRLDELGMEFIFDLNSIIETKKVPVNDYNSNILSYLCWNNRGSF